MGVMPTRNSCGLISVGQPILMLGSSLCDFAQSLHRNARKEIEISLAFHGIL
jgi:hypothetical protein